MHRIITSLGACFIVLMLTACATATPYQPAGSAGYGYKSQKIESDRYRVSFKGNSQTDKDTVRNYLLYRAAELTLAHGDDYFIVANQGSDKNVQQNTTVVGSPFLYDGFFFGGGFGGTAVTSSESEYEAYGVIIIKKGNKPADNSMAYDARQVKDNLESTVKRPR